MFIDREASDDPGQRLEENCAPSFSNDEPVKITLIGTRSAISRMIGLMHSRNIISGSEWSRPIPIKHSQEFISVASRMIHID